MLKQDTIKIQDDLAMYCRTGKPADIPNVTEGRLPHYRRLVLNVVKGTIDQAFPITRKVMLAEEWKYMFDSFFVEHDAQTPILWKLPLEFYTYVKDKGFDKSYNKPWLSELLWFEWLEIEVHMMPDQEHGKYHNTGDLLNDPLVMNRDSRLIQLEYPYHLYPVNEAEKHKGKYYIFIYRETDTGTVRFVNLSVLHAWIFDVLEQNGPLSAKEFIPELIKTFNISDTANLESQLKKFLKEMLLSGAILGFYQNKNIQQKQ